MPFTVATEADIKQQYPALVELGKLFHHDIGRFGDDDTLRWKPHAIVSSLGRNMEAIWHCYQSGEITLEEMMKFYVQIGYTLCGFCELFCFGDHDLVVQVLWKYEHGAKELRI